MTLTETDIETHSKAYGVKTISGKIPWQQEQFGSKREAFADGMKKAIEIMKAQNAVNGK